MNSKTETPRLHRFITLVIAAWVAAAANPVKAAPPGSLSLAPGPDGATAKKPEIDVSARDLIILYDNKKNSIIEEFSLTGEFQTQWAGGNSNQGSYGTRDFNPNSLWGDVEVRRWRLGFDSKWFNSVELWGTVDVNPRWNPFYKDIYELALSYSPTTAFAIGVGKIKTRYFSQEWNTRTRESITFEQSLLVNEVIPQQLTGAWIDGRKGDWIYALAAYAGDYETEFARFNAGAVIQASVGYDFASAFKADKALVKLDYQGSTSTRNSDGPGKFSNAFSLNTTYENGRFYGFTDLIGGLGQGRQGDVWGLTVTPTYFLIPNKLQAIMRLQYAHGDNDGLQLQKRYEALAPDLTAKGVGSDYEAVYFGMNYYIHRHNLKLMTGVEYNHMTGGPQNFSGWTYLAGLRAAF